MSSSNNNNDIPPLSISLSATGELPAIPSSHTKEFLLMASLVAPKYRAAIRAPIDLVCVIDRSGSMGSDSKLELVKRTLNFAVDGLAEEDKLCLVTFDDRIATEYPLTLQTKDGKERAHAAVDVLKPGSSTNLCGGLIQGLKEIKQRQPDKKNEVCSVLLFTDGLANVGPATPPDILAQLKKEICSSPQDNKNNNNNKDEASTPASSGGFNPLPCTLNTFGFGADHDPNLLRKIAEEASGQYFYVDSPENIARAFADCIGGLLSVVGQDMRLIFEAGTGIQIKKVFSKYRSVEVVPGARYETVLGDMQSEEKRDVLLLVELPHLDEPIWEFPVVNISLEYTNVLTKVADKIKVTFALDRPAVVLEFQPNFEVDKQYNRILAADAMDQANEAGKKSNFKQGQEILNNVIKRIKESISGKDPFCVSLVTDLEKCKAGLQNQDEYKREGQQMLNMNYMAHGQQRMGHSGWNAQMHYDSGSRAANRMAYMK